MTLWIRYAMIGLGLIALGCGVLYPLLSPSARRGVVMGASIAYPIQLVAFGLLVRYRDELGAFLAVWAGGTLVRMGSVLVVGLLLMKSEVAAPAAFLLSMAGFFLGLLLLESLFLRPRALETN